MFSSLSRKRVFVLLILTSLLLITLDRRHNAAIDAARSGFQRVLQPFDTATDAISKPIARAWYGITNYDNLERENQALRDQVDAQKGADVEARQVIYQDQQLQQLYQLSSDYTPVFGRVVGAAPSNFQNTVEINVGSRRGIAVGMPVTNGAGLIGKITKVYADSSVVLLITDPQYSVAAEVLSPMGGTGTGSSTTTVATTPSGQPVPTDPGSSTSTTTTSTLPDLTPPGGVRPSTTTIAGASTSAGSGDTPAGGVTTTTVPVEIRRETGTLQGQGAGKPVLLRFIDDTSTDSAITVGATVDTAGGTNGLAPQGLPIGTITKISPQSGSQSRLVEVTPTASLKQLNFVSVVLYTPGQTANG